MKKLLLSCIILFSTMSFGQELTYEQVQSATKKSDLTKEKIVQYTSKIGKVYKIGDEIKINRPEDGKVFTSMAKRMTVVEALSAESARHFNPNIYARDVANGSLKIKTFVIEGDKKLGFFISANLDGQFNNIQVKIDLAEEVKEIGESTKTSQEALTELKTEKEKLELGLITQDAFNKRKEELIKYIN